MSMTRRDILRVAAAMGFAGPAMAETEDKGAPPGMAGRFTLAGDWTFGRNRLGATVSDHAELAKEFRFRYIYDNGRLDGLPTYWSKHRDYPDGDPRALHVFTDDALVLKGRVPPGGGLHPGGIESGMLRALLPIEPGMVVAMRAKLPHGLGTWPAFWLNPGVERPDGRVVTPTPWPPEIDIFEFFEWQGRDHPRIMTAHTQTAGNPAAYGDPHPIFSRFQGGSYDTGIDFSAGFHVFALDWQRDQPVWLLDGTPIQQMHYVWNAPPAHLLVTNQIGMTLKGVDLTGMRVEEDGWDYTIDWLRVWRRV